MKHNNNTPKFIAKSSDSVKAWKNNSKKEHNSLSACMKDVVKHYSDIAEQAKIVGLKKTDLSIKFLEDNLKGSPYMNDKGQFGRTLSKDKVLKSETIPAGTFIPYESWTTSRFIDLWLTAGRLRYLATKVAEDCKKNNVKNA